MSPSQSRLKTLHRSVVIDALAAFGFAEYEDSAVVTRMWGTNKDGKDVFLRIPGIELIPPTMQKALIAEAGISVSQWLFAVSSVEAKRPPHG